MNSRRRFSAPALLPHLLTALIAAALWNVFFPAIMSTDSLLQYEQASTGEFTDWHPPIMAITLRAFIVTGLDIAALALLQCLAALFGIRRVASVTLAYLFGDDVSERARAWLSLAVLVILLAPATPWLFYAMTFWKDVWAMIVLLWITAESLDLWLIAPGRAVRGVSLRLSALVALMVLLAAVRHNALPVLLVLGVVAAMLARRHGRRFARAFVVGPLVAFFVFNVALVRAFHVRHEPIANTVMTLDLVGMCVVDDQVCADLPYTKRNLIGDAYRIRYKFGDYESLETADPPVLERGILEEANNPSLVAEYRHAVLRHPLTLAYVKACAFVTMLGLDETVYYVESTVEENELDIAMNSRWSDAREELADLAWGAAQDPVWRWVSAVHGVWIVVTIGWIVALAARWRRGGDGGRPFFALVLLVPLAYYATYLLATVARDYRYMAPATLLVQAVTVAGVLGAVARRIMLHKSAKSGH